MGCCESVADNEDVTHQSGFSRMMNNIMCAVCVAPILLIVMCFVLGWNERRAVCDTKAIAAGRDEVLHVACTGTEAGVGELVMMGCNISKDGLPTYGLPGTDFAMAISFVGTGFKVESEMYQCVEHTSSHTKKDSVGGGKTTVTTYTYSKEWRSSRVDSGAFHKKNSQNFQQNCNTENPPWPAGVPASSTQYAEKVNVGAFTTTMTSSIPLNARVTGANLTFWELQGDQYTTTKYRISIYGQSQNIGNVRVRFKSTDWSQPRVTLLGKNSNGVVEPWTAPSSWLCSGFTLSNLRMGNVGKDKLFEALRAEAQGLTFVLRLVGFFLMWLAFSLCFGPLEVATDCIPCIGPCLGDSIACVTCCVACLPATACSLGVIGAVWVTMRPMVGLPLMGCFFLIMCGFAGWKVHPKNQGEQAGLLFGVPPPQEQPGRGMDPTIVGGV